MESKRTLHSFKPPEQARCDSLQDAVDILLYKNMQDGIPTGEVLYFQERVTPADLETLAALPFEVAFYKDHRDNFVLVAGEKDSVHSTGGFGSFHAHNHLGDLPVISEPEDTRFVEGDEIDMIASRYGITIIAKDAARMPIKEVSLKDIVLHARNRAHLLELEQKQRGVSAGFIHFTETHKMQLLCNFINGEKEWEEIQGGLLEDA